MTGPFRLNRTLIRVSGPEARPFLHNLLTQNVETLAPGEVRYAGLLTPQGKVHADMLLWGLGVDIIVDADPARGSALLQRLRMYKLRAQANVEPADEFGILFAEAQFEGAHPDPRFADGALGWRALRPAAAITQAHDGVELYHSLRLKLGAPDLAHDAAPDEVFAGEALFEELNGVDFQKGCFVGQENVSRMKRRATTRKKFCPLSYEGEALETGATVQAGPAELGSVRAAAPGRALALLRLDRALAAARDGVALQAGGRRVALDPPPWLILPETE